ncbi:multidrug effflux MFS transporter [Streptomyces sp. NRRL B-24484]|uniref:multidrug effflux MFS transporter n=1 Tax=Streptomyces sp. NRRL B-24484 TaxID=1463833 RepID=UPI00069355F9|nr:multidrug effflux MFS transporter [Streptomyces sp. NRRL B-24484]
MSSTARTKGGGAVVAILGALTALGPLSNDTYLPGLPDLTHDLHASASAGQLSLTACLLGLGLGQLFAGPISDAAGRRKPLLWGLGVYTVAALLCAVAPNIWLLVALRAIQGLGGAVGIVIAAAVVRDKHEGAAAAKYFALLMLITGLAPVLAPVAGGQLLRFTSWHGIFTLLGVLGALLLVVVAVGLPETHPVERRRTGGLRATGPVFRRLLSDRVFVGYNLACGLAFAAMFAYIAGSPFVLQDIHGMSPQGFSAVFAVNAAGLVICAQICGRIVHRTGPRPLLAIGLTGSAVGGLGLLVTVLADGGLVPLLVALFVVVSSVGLVMPTATALALQEHGDSAGSAAALLGLSQHIIGAAVVPLVGLAGEGTAVPMGIVIAVLGSGALLSFAALTRAAAAPAAAAGADTRSEQAAHA